MEFCFVKSAQFYWLDKLNSLCLDLRIIYRRRVVKSKRGPFSGKTLFNDVRNFRNTNFQKGIEFVSFFIRFPGLSREKHFGDFVIQLIVLLMKDNDDG